jgi:protein gp37
MGTWSAVVWEIDNQPKTRVITFFPFENNDYVWRADELRKVPAVVRFVSYEPALGPLDKLDLTGIHWVIYGGESGAGYRREDKQWARDIMARCRDAGVAFFHKQSASYRTEMGIELDGKIVREYPKLTVLQPKSESQSDISFFPSTLDGRGTNQPRGLIRGRKN